MRYPIFIEKDPTSDYGVTVPDLPGCFSAGSTLGDAVNNAEEAILTHVEGILMDDEIIPTPSTIQKLKAAHNNPDYVWMLCEVDLNKLSENIKRINITIPEKVLSKVDNYASKQRETRSGFLMHAALDYISRHSMS
ncbi:type II toxin-antitoxin system HicB family antitoxin [Spirochaeta dissipatitropha]